MNGDGPILLTLAALCVTAVATVLPQVNDPWPETIGVEFPFTTAGGGSVVGLVAAELTNKSKVVRDRWARYGLTAGFVAGSCLYLIAVVAQLLSVLV